MYESLGKPPPRPPLFLSKEGNDWMLAAAEKADRVNAEYERKHGDFKKARQQRAKDFMDWIHNYLDNLPK